MPPAGKERNGTLFRCLFYFWRVKVVDKKGKIIEELKKRAENGKISCSVARKVARDLDISPREVGAACDELKIKIFACELGCF